MTTTSVDDDLDGAPIDAGLGVEEVAPLVFVGGVGASRPWRPQERDLNHCHKRLDHLHSRAGAWPRAQVLPFLLHSSSHMCHHC